MYTIQITLNMDKMNALERGATNWLGGILNNTANNFITPSFKIQFLT